MERGATLTRKPIESVEFEVDPQFEEVCKRYLEKQGCSVARVKPGWCLVLFPEGTHEEERAGLSTQYTRRSYVVFPSQVEMPMYTAYPLNPSQHTRIGLGFPPEIFPL